MRNQNPTTGPQQAASWAVRESFVAVVTSSIPMVWGWIRPKLRPLYPSFLTSIRHKNKDAQDDNDVASGDFRERAFLENQPHVPMSAATRQNITRSGNWTSVCAEKRPTLKSVQCKTVITKKVDIEVSRSVAAM